MGVDVALTEICGVDGLLGGLRPAPVLAGGGGGSYGDEPEARARATAAISGKTSSAL